MNNQQSQVELKCWWCGKPADPDSTKIVTMSKKKIVSRTTRVERSLTQSQKVPIFRCNQCKIYQEKIDWVLYILSLSTILISVGACYLGSLIQGKDGWMDYAFGIGAFVIMMVIMVFLNIRREKRMPEEYHIAKAKKLSDYWMIDQLKKEGWIENT